MPCRMLPGPCDRVSTTSLAESSKNLPATGPNRNTTWEGVACRPSPRSSIPSISGPAGRPTGSCSGRTRPTWVTSAGSRRATSPTTSAEHEAGAARSLSKKPPSTPPTGPTSAVRSPRTRPPAGPESPTRFTVTARSASLPSATPAVRGRRPTASESCGRPVGSPRSTRAKSRSGWSPPTSMQSSTGSPAQLGPPPRLAATASRSTPASTALCASSCLASRTIETTSGDPSVSASLVTSLRPCATRPVTH